MSNTATTQLFTKTISVNKHKKNKPNYFHHDNYADYFILKMNLIYYKHNNKVSLERWNSFVEIFGENNIEFKDEVETKIIIKTKIVIGGAYYYTLDGINLGEVKNLLMFLVELSSCSGSVKIDYHRASLVKSDDDKFIIVYNHKFYEYEPINVLELKEPTQFIMDNYTKILELYRMIFLMIPLFYNGEDGISFSHEDYNESNLTLDIFKDFYEYIGESLINELDMFEVSRAAIWHLCLSDYLL